MSKTYYLVIDDDCRPALYPVGPNPITPEVPIITCPPICPPVTTPRPPVGALPPVTPVPPFRPIPPIGQIPSPVPPITPGPPIFNFPTATVTTNGNNLNLRREPSTDAEVIARIPNGSQVTVLDQGLDGWLNVSHNNMTGFVASRWIVLNQPDPMHMHWR